MKKKSNVIILLLLFVNLHLLMAQTNKFLNIKYITTSKKAEFYLYLAKNYNSNALAILNYRSPDYYTKWSNGENHYQMLSSYGTAIHETCHAINFDIGGVFSKGYYIAPKIEIKVPTTDVFKSSEMDKDIPANLKNKIFRYKTYIQGSDGDEELSSIKDGIYGLMDEFDAYYQGTRVEVELYGYYKTFASYSNPKDWALYISNCHSTIYAYYEFRLFIAWYLKFAKKKYPEIYSSIIKNKNLKVAYTLVDIAYQKAIGQYFLNRKSIVSDINQKGVKKAVITEKFFKIVNKNGSSYGYGIPDADIEYLKSLYTNEDYQMLKLLSIENLNELNFKTFLD